jgi:hypothetical protein
MTMTKPIYAINELGHPVYWSELFTIQPDLAEQGIAQLEDLRKDFLMQLDNAQSVNHEQAQRVTELKEALERFVAVAQAVIEHPCEVNWTALQYNIAEARRLL